MGKIIEGIYIGAYIDKVLFEKFRRLTFEKNITKAIVIRKLVEDWCKKEEKKWKNQNQ